MQVDPELFVESTLAPTTILSPLNAMVSNPIISEPPNSTIQVLLQDYMN